MYDSGFGQGSILDVLSSWYTIAFYIVAVVGMWKLFGKAGEKRWKVLIPFYNSYVLYKMCWEAKWFFVDLVASIGTVVCYAGVMTSAIIAAFTGNGTWFALLSILTVALFAFIIWMQWQFAKYMAASFGQKDSTLTKVGLMLVPSVLYIVMGFMDKYQYAGNGYAMSLADKMSSETDEKVERMRDNEGSNDKNQCESEKTAETFDDVPPVHEKEDKEEVSQLSQQDISDDAHSVIDEEDGIEKKQDLDASMCGAKIEDGKIE